MHRSKASCAFTGSTPLMNRAAASVMCFSFRAVWRMLLALKAADSKNTALVFSVISLFKPPMTPATPTPPWGSLMRSMSLSMTRSFLSNVTTFSPSSAFRTMMCPSRMQARSKAWVGWPYSTST